jgi:SAM-dependent methyltransferase
VSSHPLPPAFGAWMAALEARHLANLTVPEVTRALRALSSAYVHRRHTLRSGAPLDSAGKRAAFALFYGPLHFLTVWAVLDALGAAPLGGGGVVDLGCGTGAAGAAWAVAGARVTVSGIDRHPWACAEARWTYGQFGLRGHARVGDLTRLPRFDAGTAALAAYVLNELDEPRRDHVLVRLADAARAGARVLILEPVARGIAPWWERAQAQLGSGARADEWRFQMELPPFVRLLDKAAGLDHRELTVRTLSCNVA